MFNERNQRIKEAGPSEPALILGLNGAPTAGDNFNVMSHLKINTKTQITIICDLNRKLLALLYISRLSLHTR